MLCCISQLNTSYYELIFATACISDLLSLLQCFINMSTMTVTRQYIPCTDHNRHHNWRTHDITRHSAIHIRTNIYLLLKHWTTTTINFWQKHKKEGKKKKKYTQQNKQKPNKTHNTLLNNRNDMIKANIKLPNLD